MKEMEKGNPTPEGEGKFQDFSWVTRLDKRPLQQEREELPEGREWASGVAEGFALRWIWEFVRLKKNRLVMDAQKTKQENNNKQKSTCIYKNKTQMKYKH